MQAKPSIAAPVRVMECSAVEGARRAVVEDTMLVEGTVAVDGRRELWLAGSVGEAVELLIKDVLGMEVVELEGDVLEREVVVLFVELTPAAA